MGIHKLPTIDSYWKDNFVFKNKIPMIMTKIYLKLLNSSLHLCADEEINYDKSFDPREKVSKLLNNVSTNFQEYFKMGTNLTIDKSVVFFHERSYKLFFIFS